MRPITRQSTCLACQRRLCQSPARRTFQTSVHRASDTRPPNSHPEDSSSFHHARDRQSAPDNVANDHIASRENGHEETKNASETRGSSFRKAFRVRRTPEAPKPPPIPEWFMRNNVWLSEHLSTASQSPSSDSTPKPDPQTIQCFDRRSENILFEIPGYTSPEDQDHKPSEERGHDSNQKDRSSSDTASASDRGADDLSANDQPSSDLKKDFFVHNTHPTSSPEIASNKPKDRYLSELSPRALRSQQSSPSYTGKVNFRSPSSDIDSVGKVGSDPLRWAFLEAEASVRAALALPTLTAKPSSFAASRVDISLQCPDLHSHEFLDDCVAALARHVDADLIRLDANDIAELTADYVGQGYDEPKSFANLGYDIFEGYQMVPTQAQNTRFPSTDDKDEEGKDDDVEDELDEENASEDTTDQGSRSPTIVGATVVDLGRVMARAGPILDQLRGSIVDIGVGGSPRSSSSTSSPQGGGKVQTLDSPRDDAKLSALLDQLLQAPMQKRSDMADQVSEEERLTLQASFHFSNRKNWERRWLNDRKMHTPEWRADTAQMVTELSSNLLEHSTDPFHEVDSLEELLGAPHLDLRASPKPSADVSDSSQRARKTIVHVRDLRDICASQMGNNIVDVLLKAVRRKRSAGEQVVIVGTTAQDVPGPFAIAGESPEDNVFRAINMPPALARAFVQSNAKRLMGWTPIDFGEFPQELDNKSETYWRVHEINARHVQIMLRTLQPGADIDLFDKRVLGQMKLPHMPFSGERVLSYDEVHRLALTAVGLCQHHAKAHKVTPFHLSLANAIITRSDFVSEHWPALKKLAEPKLKNGGKSLEEKRDSRAKAESHHSGPSSSGPTRRKSESNLDQIKKACNSHETRLLSGVVDPHSIKTGFDDVHATHETIDALKMLTTLSLLRPEAFQYGVLANDRLSGLLLYGPPGTGKTLLAKAVAKQSKANVMEVSGAQIYEKYVGEGEKMVRAVFSLAKKLSPCIVFMDEADAIFGSRSNAGNRSTHREIINQFLREWDGMDDHGVFLMVATNRPFDLDDAVLRRLPRRLLVDLPVAKDRESILGIHLRNEDLDSSVSIAKLAEQTPLYSGSDLKNLAVAAALAAVREENDRKEEDPDFKYPEKRTLTEKHFSKALTEISASISEDMSTLNAIRKFDEQYGDRKGRRKKSGMGFGASDGPLDESAARVRQSMFPGEQADLGSHPGASPTPP